MELSCLAVESCWTAKASNPLELTGRVELSSQVSSVWASFHLRPSDLADGEEEWQGLQEP